MKRALIFIIVITLCASGIFADTDDDFFGGTSDDELFGGADESFGGFGGDDGFFFGNSDNDLFSDDDMFVTNPTSNLSENTASDLKHGVLFQTGSIKIGGTFDLGLNTLTSFKKGKDAGESFKDTILLPEANAELSIDARPSENLRFYGSGGINYPYLTKGNSMLFTAVSAPTNDFMAALRPNYDGTISNESFQHLFYVKELFSDFNFGDYASFRFGKQTVTWGVGYFFSPADVINLTAIDPENPSKQVEGPLSLRTQFVFPGTQHAIWGYVIPDNDFNISENGIGVYARDTAFALKGDVVLGNWELGLGGWYKHNHAPRAMLTASGALAGKISVFGEGVFAYGQDAQWADDKDKDIVLQGTLGASYYWKNPKITLAGQYFYNGNNEDYFDPDKKITKHGNNIAVMASFGKLFVNDLSASLYGIIYTEGELLIGSAMISYSPIAEFKISLGPYFTWMDFDANPTLSVKLGVSLGSGRF